MGLNLQPKLMTLAVCVLVACLFPGCSFSKAKSDTSMSATVGNPGPAGKPAEVDLAEAVAKLQNAIDQPAEPFHISLEKTNSDGFSSRCEADITRDGIFGQQTDSSPTTKIGDKVFQASSKVRQLRGSPVGSADWSVAKGAIVT